jgi:hypothetical protein
MKKQTKNRIKEQTKYQTENHKKGFIVTLDAIIALVLSLFFISYTFSIVNSFPSYESVSYVKMQRIGQDALNAMEMTNSFGSQSTVNEIFQQTGDQICMKLEIYNQSFTPAARKDTFMKPGCNPKKDQEINSGDRSFRTFYQDGDFKYAVISVWLKETT